MAIVRKAAAILIWMLGAALSAGSAHALSFSVPAGRTIVDVDFSGPVGLSYDGTTETLTMAADVDVFRLDDTTQVTPTGTVSFNVTLMLTGTTSVLGSTASASFMNGLASDFTLIDDNATASLLDDEVVFAGDFTGPALLEITASIFGTTGDFGGGTQAGAFTVSNVNPALAGQVLPTGDLSAFLTNFTDGSGGVVTSLAPLLDGGVAGAGFQDFDAQPNIDFNLVPEPASGLLPTLAALWVARRLGRRRP